MSTDNFIVEYEKKILPKKIFTFGLIFAVVGCACFICQCSYFCFRFKYSIGSNVYGGD